MVLAFLNLFVICCDKRKKKAHEISDFLLCGCDVFFRPRRIVMTTDAKNVTVAREEQNVEKARRYVRGMLREKIQRMRIARTLFSSFQPMEKERGLDRLGAREPYIPKFQSENFRALYWSRIAWLPFGLLRVRPATFCSPCHVREWKFGLEMDETTHPNNHAPALDIS